MSVNDPLGPNWPEGVILIVTETEYEFLVAALAGSAFNLEYAAALRSKLTTQYALNDPQVKSDAMA